MSDKPKKTRLMNLDAFEVSLVPFGKNNRKILALKEGEHKMEEILKQLAAMTIENEADLDKKIDEILPESITKEAGAADKIKSTIKAVLKTSAVLKEMIPEGNEDLMKSLNLLAGGAKPEEVKKEAPVAKPDPKTVQSPEVAEILKEQLLMVKEFRDENKALKEEIKKERDSRVDKEYVAKAKEIGFVGEKAEEIAKSLRQAKDNMTETAYNTFETVLKSQNEQIKQSGIFKELGNPGTVVSASLDAKIDAAKEEIKKEHSDWTKEKVEAEVWNQHPSLYTEYLDENPKQGGY